MWFSECWSRGWKKSAPHGDEADRSLNKMDGRGRGWQSEVALRGIGNQHYPCKTGVLWRNDGVLLIKQDPEFWTNWSLLRDKEEDCVENEDMQNRHNCGRWIQSRNRIKDDTQILDLSGGRDGWTFNRERNLDTWKLGSWKTTHFFPTGGSLFIAI